VHSVGHFSFLNSFVFINEWSELEYKYDTRMCRSTHDALKEHRYTANCELQKIDHIKY
jgi:hypothetical protein